MIDASTISKAIRMKKKKFTEDKDVVSLSGIPKDATDLEIDKDHEATDHLNMNEPKEHDDGSDESPAMEASEQEKMPNEQHEESNTMNPEHELMQLKKLKMKKIGAMMSKMK